MECFINPTEHTVFQARLYKITDELIAEPSFSSMEDAVRYLLTAFNHDECGPLLARGVVRTVDPFRKDWIVPWSADNNKALLLNETAVVVDAWKTTYYDMSDTIMLSEIAAAPVLKERLEKQMIAVNAFYVVVSCREKGCPGRYIIARTYRNMHFSLCLRYEQDVSE